MLTQLFCLTFVKMGLSVVYWENKKRVSVANEKNTVGTLELKEGRTVDISTSSNKGRVAIYKATILKVCGEYKLRCSLRD